MSAADDRLARQAARAARADDNPLVAAFLAGMAAANLSAARPPVALPPGIMRIADRSCAAGDVDRKDRPNRQQPLSADPGHGIT